MVGIRRKMAGMMHMMGTIHAVNSDIRYDLVAVKA